MKRKRPSRPETHKKKSDLREIGKKVMKLNSLTSQIRINLKIQKSWKQ